MLYNRQKRSHTQPPPPPPSQLLQTRDRTAALQVTMLRHVFLVVLFVALAYVHCKPASLRPLHRAKRWEEFPNVTFTFDCSDRAVGFYADMEHHCQIFHMCDEDGRRIPYLCANDTSFNQEYRVCDWEYNFDCQKSQDWYYLNELTYVTDPPKPKNARPINAGQ
ncbi:uncharacterized protein LOC126249138 [Schistocerca nitens]|uniref:uncharacterized protein LOC126249138 n=2 Tax=Schistocerca TaxID=7008 RepID=UPI002118916D|nr:uncharacterized protein LOC126249138 [Schistocerca nitens]